MNEESKKKVSSGLVVFLSVLTVGFAVWAGYSYIQSTKYKIQLENTYLRAISETSTNMSNLSSDLVKGLYAGTPTQMSVVSSKLWKEASSAKSALSALPISDMELDSTYRFLSQVGDYAMYLSKKSISDQRITPEERQQFLKLREYADRLNAQVDQMQNRLANQELSFDELIASTDTAGTVGETLQDNSTNTNNQPNQSNSNGNSTAQDIVNDTGRAIEDAAEDTGRAAGELANDAADAVGDAADAVGDAAKGTAEAIGDAGKSAEKVAEKAADAVGEAVKDAGDAAGRAAESVIPQPNYATPPAVVQTSVPQAARNDSKQSTSNPSAGEQEGNNSFEAMEKGFTGYPSLIYDGPFSDHILDKKPEMTAGKSEITQSEALTKAAKAASVEASALTNTREENSTLPSYVFYNDGVSVAVTKNGGMLSYMIKPKTEIIAQVISKEDAIAASQKYLQELGIQSMKETYYEISDGVMTINFAHYESGRQVVCYTDLVKVQVSMSDGSILGCDARGYLVNHKSRTFSEPKLSREEAQKSLSENLMVESVRFALIPSDGQNEVYTYEFLCNGTAGDKVLVYVNADTGVEEQILILLETPNGVLTK